jgi:hypothetical protein
MWLCARLHAQRCGHRHGDPTSSRNTRKSTHQECGKLPRVVLLVLKWLEEQHQQQTGAGVDMNGVRYTVSGV